MVRCPGVYPGAQRGDQQDIQKPVQDTGLCEPVLDDLAVQQADQLGVRGTHQEPWRQRLQHQSPQLGVVSVGAYKQLILTQRIITPCTEPGAQLFRQVAAVWA